MTERRRLFVLGDSISIHYGPYLRDMTRGVFQYSRLGSPDGVNVNTDGQSSDNGGDSRRVLRYLQEQEARGTEYDVLLLNCGLHDIRRDRATGVLQVEPREYRNNLDHIFALARRLARMVVWVETTPVDDLVHNNRGNGFLRHEQDVLQYNGIAAVACRSHGIAIIGLHDFTAALGDGMYCDHVHYKQEARALQAAFMAGALQMLFNSSDIETTHSIDHLNRYVSDVEAFISFYTNALGYRLLKKGLKANGQPFAILQGNGHELFISQRDGFQAETGGNFRHIGYAAADADGLLADLKAKGLAPMDAQIIVKAFSRQFYLLDPDGLEIDLIQWTDKDGFYSAQST